MTTFSKEMLSGSTGGRGVKVAATASSGTLVHATGTSATVKDEVWLYATNTDTVAIAITVQWGGTTATDDDIVLTIPAKSGLTLVVPGLVLVGTGSVAREVRVYAGTANKVTIHGYVNRVT